MKVGLNTVVEFLHKKGFTDEEFNSNSRLSDEQYALLVKEFGKNMAAGGSSSFQMTKSQKKKMRDEEVTSEIKTEIPEEFRPKIVTKGHIDLNATNKAKRSKSANKRRSKRNYCG